MSGDDHSHEWRLHSGPDWDEIASCHECGLRMLRVLTESRVWVGRRVERIVFLDDRTIRRSVSVDYQSPAGAVTLRAGKDVELRVLPFAVMRRKSLIKFDFRDEEDRPMSLLGLRETQALTRAIARAWASESLRRSGSSSDLTEAVDDFLHDVVAGDQLEMEAAYRRLTDPGADAELRALAVDEVFRAVIDRLANNFIAFSLDRGKPGSRQVVKFSYDEPLMLRYSEPGYKGYSADNAEPTYAPGPLLDEHDAVPLKARFGFEPTRIRFPVPGAEMAASYHVEIEAPPDVSIEEASLLAGRPNHDDSKPRRLRGPSFGDETGPDRVRNGIGSRPSFDRVGGGYPTVDLHVSGVPLGSLSRAQVTLQPTLSNWLPIALSCLLVSSTLGAASAAALFGQADGEQASSLLIGFTAAVAGMLLRPDPHRMATHLLTGLRLVALTAAALAFASAVLFTFFPGLAKEWIVIFFAISLVPTIAGAVAHRRARERMAKSVTESPWEQRIALNTDGRPLDRLADGGRSGGSNEMTSMVAEIDQADHPYDKAASLLDFDVPAIRVESSEGARQTFPWTTRFEADFLSRLPGARAEAADRPDPRAQVVAPNGSR